MAPGVPDERQAQPAGGRHRQRPENRGHLVGRRHQVQVVAIPFLEAQKDPGQPLGIEFLAVAAGADLVILAIDAGEVAAAEEDRPRAALATQAVFLTVMRSVPVHNRPLAREAFPEGVV